MSDNTELNPMSGGDVILTEDLGASKVQVVKVGYGAVDTLTRVDDPTGLPTRPALPKAQKLSWARIDTDGASGDKVLVAAVGGQTVRLFFLLAVADGPVTMKIGDTTVQYFIGPMLSMLNLTLDFIGEPYVVTATGKGLVLNLGTAVHVGGLVGYTQST